MNGKSPHLSPSPAFKRRGNTAKLARPDYSAAALSRKPRAWFIQVSSSANPKMNSGTSKLE
jgi:hypothetical protein